MAVGRRRVVVFFVVVAALVDVVGAAVVVDVGQPEPVQTAEHSPEVTLQKGVSGNAPEQSA